jgi:hypothetical protein
MPVLVRNTEKGPTVFSDPAKNIAIEWQGAGDPNGEDVQHVPDEVTDNVNFLKSLQRGIFVVEEASPEMQARLDKQVAAYRDRRNSSAQAGENAIDRQAERTITTAVISETGKVVNGKPEEATIPVVMGARETGPAE